MKKPILLPILTIAIMAIMVLSLTLGTAEMANKNAQKEHLWVMQTLLPGSEHFTAEPYDGEDATIRSVHKGETGFVVETVTQGYAGEIVMLIGVSQDGKVTGLTIRDMQETPGLGMGAMWDEAFLMQFLNTSGDATIGASGVDGISGATVTSKAVARCVNAAVAYVTGADVDSGATSWGG